MSSYPSLITSTETHCNFALANAHRFLADFRDALEVSQGPTIILSRDINGCGVANNGEAWFRVVQPTNLSQSSITCLKMYFEQLLGAHFEVERRISSIITCNTVIYFSFVLLTEGITRVLLARPQNIAIVRPRDVEGQHLQGTSQRRFNIITCNQIPYIIIMSGLFLYCVGVVSRWFEYQ